MHKTKLEMTPTPFSGKSSPQTMIMKQAVFFGDAGGSGGQHQNRSPIHERSQVHDQQQIVEGTSIFKRDFVPPVENNSSRG